jgi:hypothetical protein
VTRVVSGQFNAVQDAIRNPLGERCLAAAGAILAALAIAARAIEAGELDASKVPWRDPLDASEVQRCRAWLGRAQLLARA